MQEAPEWWASYREGRERWHVWQGVTRLYYGRIPRSSPPVLIRGESPEELADMITHWQGVNGRAL